MTDSKPSPSSGNPSPEPSAESLAEALERLDAWERADDLDEEWDLERIFALALDAAKRSSRREALGQAADALKVPADSLRAWMLSLPLDSPERKDKSLRAGELYAAERMVRALMEAE